MTASPAHRTVQKVIAVRTPDTNVFREPCWALGLTKYWKSGWMLPQGAIWMR